jgi:hypothetical protein
LYAGPADKCEKKYKRMDVYIMLNLSTATERVSRTLSIEREDNVMDTTTLLIIVLIILLVGGGGFYGRGRWW